MEKKEKQFADYFGRKKVLLVCFIFYQISFALFFFSNSFFLAALAMFFFGLGKAFRSGSHKAMIYTYLEQKGWEKNKTFVYGKTRSYSLLGTAISSVLAIAIILSVPHSRFIFLASIVPFVLDFFLILSYPNSLNKSEGAESKNLWSIVKESAKELKNNATTRRLILNHSFYDGLFKSIEDFIQPILSAIILGSGVLLFSKYNSETNLNIILGLTYAFINLINVFGSRSAYLFKNALGARNILNYSYLFIALVLTILGLFINSYILVIVIFLFLNIVVNVRKPIFVGEIGNAIPKNERATILSIDSQLKSLAITISAPIVGFLAEQYSLSMAMYACSGFVILTLGMVWLKPSDYTKDDTKRLY